MAYVTLHRVRRFESGSRNSRCPGNDNLKKPFGCLEVILRWPFAMFAERRLDRHIHFSTYYAIMPVQRLIVTDQNSMFAQ